MSYGFVARAAAASARTAASARMIGVVGERTMAILMVMDGARGPIGAAASLAARRAVHLAGSFHVFTRFARKFFAGAWQLWLFAVPRPPGYLSGATFLALPRCPLALILFPSRSIYEQICTKD